MKIRHWKHQSDIKYQYFETACIHPEGYYFDQTRWIQAVRTDSSLISDWTPSDSLEVWLEKPQGIWSIKDFIVSRIIITHNHANCCLSAMQHDDTNKNSSARMCYVSFQSGLITKCEQPSPLRNTYITHKYYRISETKNIERIHILDLARLSLLNFVKHR